MKKNIFHLGRFIIGCLCQEESQSSKGHERGERKSATQSVKMETLLGCARFGQLVGEIANSKHHGDSGSPQEGKDGDSVGEHLEGAADHHVHVQVAGHQLAFKKDIFKNNIHV